MLPVCNKLKRCSVVWYLHFHIYITFSYSSNRNRSTWNNQEYAGYMLLWILRTSRIKEGFNAPRLLSTVSYTGSIINTMLLTVCVHDARKCLLCIFVSLLSLLHPFFLCITIFLHLPILATVGIGKRSSNISSMTLPSHGHWPMTLLKSWTACPLIPQPVSWFFLEAWVTCSDITAVNKWNTTEQWKKIKSATTIATNA